MVSLAGALISTTVLAVIHPYVHYLLANGIATGTAVAWNFTMNERWTWAPRRPDHPEEPGLSPPSAGPRL
ncbi:hypothetical protein E1B22_00290 [Thermaerobacter sp. FW80]|nr:hypothetical protein E1B22_00290 [Thermaerobacter sp. FW80]